MILLSHGDRNARRLRFARGNGSRATRGETVRDGGSSTFLWTTFTWRTLIALD